MTRALSPCLASIVALAACGSPLPPAAPPPPAPPPVAPRVEPAAPLAVAPRPDTPDAPFREHPPAAKVPSVFAPVVVEKKLKNGISVVALPQAGSNASVCVVALDATQLFGEHGGALADVMAWSMTASTRSHDRRALDAALLDVPMHAPTYSRTRDAVTSCATFPSEKLAEGLGLVAEIVAEPLFEEDVVAYQRSHSALGLEHRTEREPGQVAWDVLLRGMFGRHPYAMETGTPATARAITRKEVVALWSTMMAPSRLAVVVAADGEGAALLARAETAFGAIPPRPAPPRASPAVVVPAGPRVVVVDRPGATVANVVVAVLAPAVTAADAVPTEVAVGLLWDTHIGRGSTRIRDELNLTSTLSYGTQQGRSSSLSWMSMSLPVEKAATALAALEEARRALVDNGPTDAEMESARGFFVTRIAKSFDMTRDTASAMATYLADGLPKDAPERRGNAFAAIDAAAVSRAARRWVQGESMRVVVAGDWAKLQAPLEALGWGKVERRDANGAAPARTAVTDARH
jgi:zinc protease